MKSFRGAVFGGPLLIAALILSGCGEKVPPGNAAVKRPVVTGVALETVAPVSVNAYYETSGTVRAKNHQSDRQPGHGTVTAVNVREGDRVRAGQILVLLDDRDAAQRQAAAQAAVREARQAQESAGADRDLARVTFDRYKNLYEEKVITRQEMDEIESRRRKTELGYEQAVEGPPGPRPRWRRPGSTWVLPGSWRENPDWSRKRKSMRAAWPRRAPRC